VTRLSLYIVLIALAALCGCARPAPSSKDARNTLPSPQQFIDDADQDAAFGAAPANSRNVTAEYRERFSKPDLALTEERLAEFKDCRVILVHGLLGEVGSKVQGFLDDFDNKEQRIIGFFKDQEAALDQMEVKHQRVLFRSDRVERCAGKIVEAVEKSSEPVVLFSHSKGCIDTLDALLELQRAGKLEKVRGWIAVQGVFFGAPNADKYVEHNGRRIFGIAAMRFMGANFDAIRACSQKTRRAYMDQHADEVARLLKALPVLCFASWERPDPKDEKRYKDKDGKKAVEQKTLASAFDIQPESSVLPGADFIAKSGISHNQTVIADGKPFDRSGFTQTLFSMLADRMKAATAGLSQFE